jgi:hypothetical protein
MSMVSDMESEVCGSGEKEDQTRRGAVLPGEKQFTIAVHSRKRVLISAFLTLVAETA